MFPNIGLLQNGSAWDGNLHHVTSLLFRQRCIIQRLVPPIDLYDAEVRGEKRSEKHFCIAFSRNVSIIISFTSHLSNYYSSSIFLFTCETGLIHFFVRQKILHLRIEEKDIVTPRKWLRSLVQILEWWGLGIHAFVLLYFVFYMMMMF